MTYKHTTQFAVTQVTCSSQTEIAQAGRVGWIIRPVFNKQWLRMSLLPGLLYMDKCSFPSSVKLWASQAHRWFQEQYVPFGSNYPPYRINTSLPASRHITTGHWVNRFEALPYVYPIIFPCHDHKAGLPRSVQFNFSMGPHWWKLCGLGFRSVMELRCAAWLVSHEGGFFFEWEGGGDSWWEPCYYGNLGR